MEISKKKWSLSVIVLSIATLSVLVLTYGLTFLFIEKPKDLSLEQGSLIIIESIFYSLSIVTLALVYRYLFQENIIKALKTRKVPLLFLGGVLLCVFASWVRELLLDDGLGDIYDIKLENFKLFYAVLIAVVFEELLFRKYLVELGQGLGLRLWLSCLLSAILFALWHTTAIENSWFLIFSGLLYSYFTYLFGSIAFAVGLHLMFNLFVIFIDVGVGSGAAMVINDSYQDVSIDSGVSSVRFDLTCLAIVLIIISFIDIHGSSW